MNEPTSKVHVIDIPGLNVPKLTHEQAAIIMGATSFRTMPDAEFEANLQQRDPDLTIADCRADPAMVSGMYGEDFDHISGQWSDYTTMYYHIMDVLSHQASGPVAMWDTRVDVFINGHLPDVVTERITAELKNNMGWDIVFFKRPGITKQTWITITRPDPTDDALHLVVQEAANLLVEQAKEEHPDWANMGIKVPYHLPAKELIAFIDFLKLRCDLLQGDVPAYKTITVGRDKKNRRAFTVTLER